MAVTTVYRDVHGVAQFFIVSDKEPDTPGKTPREHKNIPALASTVQKTKRWIAELMQELQWENAQKTYHGMRAVLHALRDRLTIHETADLAAQMPMLVRGMFYEGWQPERLPVKDRNKEAFLTHISKAFPDDQGVDPERLTQAVLKIVAAHVSEGEMDDIRAIVPKPLRELFPKN